MTKELFGGKGFQSNPQNINRKGQPLKIYTILKRKGYGKADTITAFGEIAYYTMKELEDAKDNAKLPIITRIVANQFYIAYKKNDWNKIKEILEHTIGKPLQSVQQEIIVQAEQPLFPEITIDVEENEK